MNNNIFRCRKCGRFAIKEELDKHECRALVDYKKEGKITKVFDGFSWYPLKINYQPIGNTNKTTEDETEPH